MVAATEKRNRTEIGRNRAVRELRCGNLLRMAKTRHTGGRPYSVDPKRKERATARLSFALTPAQLDKLRTAARKAGVPVSVFVRDKATR
jgi:hypothetical protein